MKSSVEYLIKIGQSRDISLVLKNYFLVLLSSFQKELNVCLSGVVADLHLTLCITPMLADSGRERPASGHCQSPADTPGSSGQIAHPCQV